MAAVGVARQEEVDVVSAGPGELVGAVGECDAKGAAIAGAGRGLVEVRGGRDPGELVAGEDERLAADLDLDPTTAEVDEAGVDESLAEAVGVKEPISTTRASGCIYLMSA